MKKSTILVTIIDCNGTEVPVTTVQRPGEPFGDFAKRHEDDVARAEKACES